MDQEAEKTRAELLEEMTGFCTDRFDQNALEAIFPSFPASGVEKLSAEEKERVEREYILLCDRVQPCVFGPAAPAVPAVPRKRGEDKRSGGVSPAMEPEPDLFRERLDEAAGENGFDSFCQTVAEEAAVLMEAEFSLLAMVDAEGVTFTYRGAAGTKARSFLGESASIESASVCGWVIRQGTHFTAADVRTDLRAAREIRDVLKARSVAAAPLNGAGKITGAIAVAGSKGGAAFTDRRVCERLLPFARHVSAVLSRSAASLPKMPA